MISHRQQANGPTGDHVIQKNLSILSALQITAGRDRDCRCSRTRRAETVSGDRQPPAARAATSSSIPARRGRTNAGRPIASARWRRRLRDRTGLRSLVTWGPSERELADAVVQRVRRRRDAGAARRRFPISRSLMREAALVVSGDTGPLHIAAAMGTPLVGLYGPTWPERNGPWDPKDVVISRAERLRVPSQAPVPARRAVHQRDHAR